VAKKGPRKDTIAIYGSCATLGEEGEREKDARMERSMLRVTVGEARGAEPLNNDRRGVEVVERGDGVEASTAGSSAFHW